MNPQCEWRRVAPRNVECAAREPDDHLLERDDCIAAKERVHDARGRTNDDDDE